MKAFLIGTALSGAAALLIAAGCMQAPEEDATESQTQNQTARDWVEGAYERKTSPGERPVNFVFFRGKEGEADDTFFGELPDGDEQLRAAGHFDIKRDRYGTLLQLKMEEATESKGTSAPSETGDAGTSVTADAGTTATGDAGASASADNRTVLERAFSGNKHFLKIGQKDTILIRDVNPNGEEKTAHYKRINSWCGTKGAKDCDPSVQNAGLECSGAAVKCSTKHRCECK